MKKIFMMIISLSILLLLAGCVIKTGEDQTVTIQLSGKSILMIVAPQDFRDEELFTPKQLFESAGAQVTVASRGTDTAVGMKGGTVPIDLQLNTVNVTDYDAVVFVGGSGATVLFDDEDAQQIARTAVEQDKVLGAICLAPSILANAGVLENKKASSFISEAENLKSKGCEYTGQPVTVDGNIITGSGPEAAQEFAVEIAKALGRV